MPLLEALSRLHPFLAVLADALLRLIDSGDMITLYRSLCTFWVPAGRHEDRTATLACWQIYSWQSTVEPTWHSQHGRTQSRRAHSVPFSVHSAKGQGRLLAQIVQVDTRIGCIRASRRTCPCWLERSRSRLRRHPRTRAGPETLADGSFLASWHPSPHSFPCLLPSSVLDLSH